MKRTLTSALMAGLLWGAGVSDAQAQVGDDRVGTSAMEELLVPVTPQTVALSSALTGGLDSAPAAEVVQSNPAAIASANVTGSGTSAIFSRTEYWADTGINYFGVAQNFGANAVALTLTSWDYGDIFRTTTDNPEVDPNRTFDASTYMVGATFARQFTDRIAAGATLKGLGRSIDETSSNGVALDAGMTYVVEEAGLRFGVSLKNIGGSMEFSGTGLDRQIGISGPDGSGNAAGEIVDLSSELPTVLNFGATYTRKFEGDISATALANFRSVSYDQDNYAAGVQVGYADLVYLRGGLNLQAESEASAWGMWNVGAGLNLDVSTTSLKVDYAYRPAEFLGGVNMFSVGLGL